MVARSNTASPGPPATRGQPREQELFDQARVNQLSRDLRTPLTVIRGYAELLQEANPRADQRQSVDALVHAAANLSGVIDQLLDRAGIRDEAATPRAVVTAMYPAAEPTDVVTAESARRRGRREIGADAAPKRRQRRDIRTILAESPGTPVSALPSVHPDERGAELVRDHPAAEESRTLRAGAGGDQLTGTMIRESGHIVLEHAMDRSVRIDEPLLVALVETQREALADLQKAAATDFLTGVGNRRAIEQRLDAEWQRAHRHGRPLGVLMVDIDGLKAINDSRGHQHGDVVIAEVARRLAGAIRVEDELARIGGDEFMIVCPETDTASARSIARKLRSAVGAPPLETSGTGTSLGVSIGWASTSASLASVEELVAAADARLYGAKRRRARGGA